jgi:hypothetical protein
MFKKKDRRINQLFKILRRIIMFLAAADTIISILEKNKLAISFAEGHRSARDFYIKNRNATPKSENILDA